MTDAIFSSFGLRENPFRINPDPRFIFLTTRAEATLAELAYGIRARKGLIVLAGEVGTGKTMLLRRLLDWLGEQNMPTALIFNSHINSDHLLDFILNDFRIPSESSDKSDKLLSLNRWLLERYRGAQTPVLIVDEAQGLSLQALEEIRLLLNFETPRHKLLQVILAGQPELEEKLKRYELRQLRQRITIRCKTAPLTLEETHGYIEERLRIAGAGNESIFDPQAVTSVHAYSQGIPRVINVLCDHALVNSCADGFKTVSPRSVEQAARECQLDRAESVARILNSSASTGLDEFSSILAAVSKSSAVAERPDPSSALPPFPVVQPAEGVAAHGIPARSEISRLWARTAPAPAPPSEMPLPEGQTFKLEQSPQQEEPVARGNLGVRPNARFEASLSGALRLWRSWQRSFLLELHVLARQTRRLMRTAETRYWKPFERVVRHRVHGLESSAAELASDPRWLRLRNRSASQMRAAWGRGKAGMPVWLAELFGSARKSALPSPSRANRGRGMEALKRWLHRPLGDGRKRVVNSRNQRSVGQ